MALRISEQKVRVRMVEVGIRSLEELGRQAKITTPTLRRMFDGNEFLSSTLTRLATVLQCKPFDLLIDDQPTQHVTDPATARSTARP